jgi:hypothetical protein
MILNHGVKEGGGSNGKLFSSMAGSCCGLALLGAKGLPAPDLEQMVLEGTCGTGWQVCSHGQSKSS